MEGIMKIVFPFLVLMIIGTGFMYVHPMTGIVFISQLLSCSLFLY